MKKIIILSIMAICLIVSVGCKQEIRNYSEQERLPSLNRGNFNIINVKWEPEEIIRKAMNPQQEKERMCKTTGGRILSLLDFYMPQEVINKFQHAAFLRVRFFVDGQIQDNWKTYSNKDADTSYIVPGFYDLSKSHLIKVCISYLGDKETQSTCQSKQINPFC